MFEKHLPFDDISVPDRRPQAMADAVPIFKEYGFVVIEEAITWKQALALRVRNPQGPGVDKMLLASLSITPNRLANRIPDDDVLQLSDCSENEDISMTSRNISTARGARLELPRVQHNLGLIVATFGAQEVRINRRDRRLARPMAFRMPMKSMLVISSPLDEHHRVNVRPAKSTKGNCWITSVTYAS